jgi:hypothetical protein
MRRRSQSEPDRQAGAASKELEAWTEAEGGERAGDGRRKLAISIRTVRPPIKVSLNSRGARRLAARTNQLFVGAWWASDRVALVEASNWIVERIVGVVDVLLGIGEPSSQKDTNESDPKSND